MGSEESVILLLAFIWGISEIIGSNIIPRLRQKGEVKTRSDKGSRNIIWLSVIVSIIISYYFGTNNITPLPEWFFYFGIALMLAGIILRQWAIWVLGSFFSNTVRIVKGQKIVKSGPYKLIRHPSYTGGLLVLLGLGLASRTLAGTVVIIILSWTSFYYRIRIEEKALTTEFGQEYVDYTKKTKRLIPYIF